MINRILIFLFLLSSVSASAQIAPVQDTVPSSKSKPIVPTFRQDIVNGQRINYIYNPVTGKYDALLPANYIRKYITGSGSTVDTASLSNRINLRQKQFITNVADLGANGNGIFDNTTIINNAVAANKAVYVPNGTFLVRYLNNPNACDIQGPGQIVMVNPKTGLVLLNDHANDYQRSFGQQNLSAFHNAINNGLKPAISFHGDSRTASVADPSSAPDLLITQMEAANGIYSTGSKYNFGHPGASTHDWRYSPYPGFGNVLGYEISQIKKRNVKLMVIWYGVNDPLVGASYTATQSAAQLDSALHTIRVDSGLTESKLSIIIMTPGTATGDTLNHKGAAYYRPLARMDAKISEKYACAFFDAAALAAQIPSSRENRTGTYVDVDGASDYMEKFLNNDQFYIHNLKALNAVVFSGLFDLMYPTFYKSGGSGGNSPTFTGPVTVVSNGQTANIDYGSFSWNRNIGTGAIYNPSMPAFQAVLLSDALHFQAYPTTASGSPVNSNAFNIFQNGRVGVNTASMLTGYQFQVTGNSAFLGNVAGTGSASFVTGQFTTSLSSPKSTVNASEVDTLKANDHIITTNGVTATDIVASAFSWNRNIANGKFYNAGLPAFQAGLQTDGLHLQAYQIASSGGAVNTNALVLLPDGRIAFNGNTVSNSYQFQFNGNALFQNGITASTGQFNGIVTAPSFIISANSSLTRQTLLMNDGSTGAIANASNVFYNGTGVLTYVTPTTLNNNDLVYKGYTDATYSQIPNNFRNNASTFTLPLTNLTNYGTFYGTTATWTLGTVAAGSNVTYYIKNAGSGVLTINSAAGGNDIYYTSAVATISIAAGNAIIIHNDGVNWQVE